MHRTGLGDDPLCHKKCMRWCANLPLALDTYVFAMAPQKADIDLFGLRAVTPRAVRDAESIGALA